MNLHSIVHRFALVIAFSLPLACESDPVSKRDTADTAQAPPSRSSGHAPAQVVPGSHEDWCEEHQVPESLCTRCNPSLIAAFKATGDWCEEHAVPESQCRTCNPNLKLERPPKKEMR